MQKALKCIDCQHKADVEDAEEWAAACGVEQLCVQVRPTAGVMVREGNGGMERMAIAREGRD